MRRALFFACAMIFVSVAFAETSDPAPLSREVLAAILGQDSGDCAPTPPEVALADKRPQGDSFKALCTATARCASGTVSCSGNNSTTSCTAIDRNCSAAERGRVICDGVTTFCPTVCSPCELCAARGDCISCCRCDGGTLFQCRQECFEREPIPKLP